MKKDTSQITMYKNALVAAGAFTSNYNKLVLKTVQLLPEEIPYHLRLGITVSELVTFASHFKRPIQLFDGTFVPTNAITMLLFSSGVSKDSSLNMVRKALVPAYSILDEERNSEAQLQAEEEAARTVGDPQKWLEFFKLPPSLQAGLGTPEGLVKSFSKLERGTLGAASILTSEVGSELQTNGNFTEIVKQLSVGYDLGKIPAKLLVSDDSQLPDINGLPINALMFGSEDGILYNNTIKNLFKLLFNTQLARRSLFGFSSEPAKITEYASIDALYEAKEKERERISSILAEVQELTVEVFDTYEDKPLLLDQETQRLFDIYKEYNTLIANDMSIQYSISKLARKHKQWMALKIAGAFSVLNGESSVTEESYVHAINIVEEFADDLIAFEKSLVLEQYEVFVQYCQYSAVDNKLKVSLHQLKKLQFIVGQGTKTKTQELIKAANSKDKDGIYSILEDGSVLYERLIKSETVSISYIIFED